jgi:hypothetical protein
MIRWREERRRSFRAIAALLVALLAGGFVRIGLGLVVAAATANAVAAVVLLAVIAIFVFRAGVSRGARSERTDADAPALRRFGDDELEERVAAILTAWDPLGTDAGAYELAASTIAPRLADADSVAEAGTILREELVRWFGAEVDRTRYEDCVRDLWEAVSQHRPTA